MSGADDSKGKKYDIKVIETAKAKIPQRKASKEQIMPKYPFSMMISGSSGSGKTNLMINILSREDMFGKFFHRIAVFSPTAGSADDLYSQLRLPKENFIPDMRPAYLANIIEHRKKLIEEKGIEWVAKNDRMVIIMDDVIAERNFLESPEALKMFALLRHFLVSVIVMVQSYNKLPRSLRLNANAIMVFPALQSEIDILKDEITPPGISKADFEHVINYATQGRYDFLYINRHADPDKRIRKNLDEIIDVSKFKKSNIRSKRETLQDVLIDSATSERPKFGGETGIGRQIEQSRSARPPRA